MSNWIPLDISRVLRPEDVTTKPCKHETTKTTTTTPVTPVTPPATKARVSESPANTSTTTTAEILSLSLQTIRTIRKRSIPSFHTATMMAKRSEAASTKS